jgi:hypothetical protein
LKFYESIKSRIFETFFFLHFFHSLLLSNKTIYMHNMNEKGAICVLIGDGKLEASVLK